LTTLFPALLGVLGDSAVMPAFLRVFLRVSATPR